MTNAIHSSYRGMVKNYKKQPFVLTVCKLNKHTLLGRICLTHDLPKDFRYETKLANIIATTAKQNLHIILPAQSIVIFITTICYVGVFFLLFFSQSHLLLT